MPSRFPVSTATNLFPVSTISDFEKTEYRADIFGAQHPAQPARLADPDHVERLHNMVREDRWVNDFGLLSVAEKNPSSDPLSVFPTSVSGKLLVLPYLIDGFKRRAMSKFVDVSGIDRVSSAKAARVLLWTRKKSTSVTKKDMILVLRVLNEASSAGIPSLFLTA